MVSHQKIGVTRINRKVGLNETRVSTSSYTFNAQSKLNINQGFKIKDKGIG
jgi:hypothetical protein